MIVVLDSNEYLGFLSGNSPFAEGLFGDEKVSIFIHELIVKEVLRNLQESIKGEFYTLLFTNNIQVFHGILHSSLLQKYRNLGLKKGDIVIAAFCEHVKAEYLSLTKVGSTDRGELEKVIREIMEKNPSVILRQK